VGSPALKKQFVLSPLPRRIEEKIEGIKREGKR
jgi:hypothetical protein